MGKNTKQLEDRWTSICNEYVKEFCKRHEYDSEPDVDWYWIADNPGTLIEINDMFINMETIRYDVDKNVPEEKFEQWYWKNLELTELGVEHWLNYSSYCKGAPDIYTGERLKQLRCLKLKLDHDREEFEKTIREYSECNFGELNECNLVELNEKRLKVKLSSEELEKKKNSILKEEEEDKTVVAEEKLVTLDSKH